MLASVAVSLLALWRARMMLRAARSNLDDTDPPYASAIEFLKQAGCSVDDVQLKDRGILGNGQFMMLETNRRQVFDVIRGWIESKVSG